MRNAVTCSNQTEHSKHIYPFHRHFGIPCCENYVLRWRDNKDSGRNDAYAVGAIPLHRHHLSQNPNLFSVREFLMCLWEASLTLDFHRLSSLSKGTLTWNSSTCHAFYL